MDYTSIYQQLAKDQQDDEQYNPMLQSGLSILKTPTLIPHGGFGQNFALALAKGLGGGLLTSYGHGQLQDQHTDELDQLAKDLAATDPSEALKNDDQDRLRSYANIAEGLKLNANAAEDNQFKLFRREQAFKDNLTPWQLKHMGPNDNPVPEGIQTKSDLEEWRSQHPIGTPLTQGQKEIVSEHPDLFGEKPPADAEALKLNLDLNKKKQEDKAISDSALMKVQDKIALANRLGDMEKSVDKFSDMGSLLRYGKSFSPNTPEGQFVYQAVPEIAGAVRTIGGRYNDQEAQRFTQMLTPGFLTSKQTEKENIHKLAEQLRGDAMADLQGLGTQHHDVSKLLQQLQGGGGISLSAPQQSPQQAPAGVTDPLGIR